MMDTGFHRRSLSRLSLGTALVGSLIGFAGAAHAQNTPSTPTVVTGTATFDAGGPGNPPINGSSTSLEVDLHGSTSTIINWNSFSIADGSTTTFVANGGSQKAVLNRVTGGTASNISGGLVSDSNVSVFLVNPNGIMVGSTGAVSTGSFVASTLDISNSDFTGGTFRFTGAAGATTGITVQNGAVIQTSGGNRGLVLIAPKIDANGTFTAAANQEAAFVTASDVTLSFNPGSPLGITIERGTVVPGASQIIGGSVSGKNVYFALASQASVTGALLRVNANVTTAVASDKGIVLLAGDKAGFDPDIGSGAGDVAGTAAIEVNGSLNSTAAGSAIALGATGTIDMLGGINAGGDVTIDAGAAATVDGTLTAGGDYAVDATEVTLGGTQSAAHRVTITASAGDLNGIAGLSLTSNTTPAVGEFMSLGASGAIALTGTTLRAGTTGGAALLIRDGATLALGDVRALRIDQQTGGNPIETATLDRADGFSFGDLILTGTGLHTIHSGGALAGGAITATAGSLDLSGTTSLDLQGDISALAATIASPGGVTMQDATITNGLTITGALTGGALSAGTMTLTGGAIALTSAETTTGALSAITDAGGINIRTISSSGIATLQSAAGSGIRTNSATAAGTLTLLSGSGVAGSTGTRAALSSTGGSVDVTATGAVVLSTVGAAADVSISGTSVDASGANVTATAGSVDIDASAGLVAVGIATGATGITLDATGNLAATGANSSGGAVSLTSSGGVVSLGNANAAGNVTVNANGVANVTGNVTAAGAYSVTGSAVNLGADAGTETQQATGAVTITANSGLITGGPGLTLFGNTNDAGLEDIRFNLAPAGIDFSGATIRGGANHSSRIYFAYTDPTTPITLGDVSGAQFGSFDGITDFASSLTTGGPVVSGDLDLTTGTIQASSIATGGLAGTNYTFTATGNVLVDGPVGIDGALQLTSTGGDVTLNDDVNALSFDTTATNGTLQGQRITTSGGSILANALAIDLGALDSSTSVTLSATNALEVGGVEATAGVTLTGGSVTSGPLAAGNDILVTATAGTARVTGTVGAGGNYTVTGTNVILSGAQSAAGLVNVTAITGAITNLGALTLTSNSDDAGTEALTLDGVVHLGLDGNLRGGTARGSDVVINNALGSTLSFGNVAAHALTISGGVSSGAIQTGDIVTTTDLALQATGGIATGELTSTGGSILVDAFDSAVQLGALNAATTLSVAGNSVTFDTASAASVALSANGAGGAGSPAIGGTAITSTGAVTLDATANAGGITIGAIDAGSTLAATSAGSIALGTVNVGSTTALGTSGPAADIILNGAFTGGGTIVIESARHVRGTSIASTAGDTTIRALSGEITRVGGGALDASAGGALLVQGGTLARLGTVTGASVDLSADTITAQSATATAGNLAAIADVGDLDIGTVSSAGLASLTASGATGGVRTDTVTAAGNLTVAAAGAVGGSSGTRADFVSTGGSTTITAGGAAMLGTVGAATDVSITGNPIDVLTVNSGGSVTLASGGALAFGTIITPGSIGLTAAGDLSVGSGTSTGGSISLISTAGSVSAGNLSAATDILVDAAGAASVTGNVTAGGSYSVRGSTVALGVDGDAELQQAVGGVTVTATAGAITGGTGLTLLGNSDDAGAEDVRFNLAPAGIDFSDATIRGGANRSSRVFFAFTDPDTSVLLGAVSGTSFGSFDGIQTFAASLEGLTGTVATRGLDFSGSAAITAGAITTTGSIHGAGAALRALTGSVTVNGDIGLTGDLSLAADAGGIVLVGNSSSASFSAASAGALVTANVTATSGAIGVDASSTSMGALSAATGIDVASHGGSTSLVSATAGTTIAISGPGGVTAGALTAPGNITVTATGGQALLSDTVTGAGVTISAASADVADIAATGALNLTTTAGGLQLGTGTAASATLAAAGDLDVTGFLHTGGVATVNASGAATIADIASSGDAVSVTGGSVNVTNAEAFIMLNLSSTSGPLQLGTGTANAAALNSSGTLDVTGFLHASGAASANASGAATIADITSSGGAVLVTGSSVNVTNAEAGTTLQIDANSGSLQLGTGTAAVATLTSNGTLDVTGFLHATGDVSATAPGTATIAEITSSGGAVSVAGSSVDVTNAEAAGMLQLVSTSGALRLGTGTAGSAGLGAGDTLDLTGFLHATGDITATASGAARIAEITSSGGAVSVTGSSVEVTDAEAAGALQLASTSGSLRLGTGTAAGATLASSGTLDVADFLHTTGDASATAPGAVTIGEIVSSSGAVAVSGSTVNVTNAEAGTTLALTANSGSLQLGDGTAGTAATLEAAQAINFGTLTAGTDATLTAGTDITGDSLSAGGTISVAAGGTVSILSSAGSGIGITAAVIDLPNTVSTGSLSLTSTLGGITLAGGSAVTTAVFHAKTTLDITQPFTSGGDLTATAGGAITAGSLASTGGAIDLAGTAIDVASLDAAHDLALDAGAGDLRLGTAIVGGTSTVNAGGGAAIGSIAGTGVVSIDAGGAVEAASLASAAAGIDVSGTTIDIQAADAATGFAATSTAGALTLGSVSAGTTADLTAAGSLDVATFVHAEGDATATATGAATIADITSAAGAVSVTGTSIDAGTVGAATTLALTANAGTLDLDAGTAGAVATLTSQGAMTIGTLATGGAADLTSGAGLAVTSLDAGGKGTLKATGGATLGTTRAGAGLDVAANGIDAGATTVTGLLKLTSGGAIALTGGSATLGAELDAAQTVAVGALNGGPSIRITARDATVTGTQKATAVTFVNRSPGTEAMRLGEGTAGTGFRLSQAEINFVDAANLAFDGGTGAVEIGALAFGTQAGTAQVDVLTTGDMTISGLVSGAGATRTFRFGGTLANARDVAHSIAATATADAGGRLLFQDATLDLRGDRIAFGQSNLIAALFAGGGISAEQAAALFVSNSSSALYSSIAGGVPYSPDAQALLVAGKVRVRYNNFALFQNTAPQGLHAGVVIGGTTATPVNEALVLQGPGTSSRSSFAMFGTVNGIGGTSAAVLGAAIVLADGIDAPNSRINGCIIGSGAGCLTTTITQPTLNVFDASRLDVFRAADDFSVPFDPLVGSNNEALFTGIAAIDIPAAAAAESSDCPNGQTAENSEGCK